jgi:hypothetical protein
MTCQLWCPHQQQVPSSSIDNGPFSVSPPLQGSNSTLPLRTLSDPPALQACLHAHFNPML